MYTFKAVLFAVFALLAVSSLATVTGKFNIVSKYKYEKKHPDGHKTIEEQRNPVAYEKKDLKSDKTLDALVKNFNSWSGGDFNCKKGRHGSTYNVEATKVYGNKDESNAANNKAKKVINDHKNSE